MKPNLTALLLMPLAAPHAADGAREAVAKPVVFWASDPILPGQTALLFGDSIGAGVVAEGERVPDAPLAVPAEPAGPPTVVRGYNSVELAVEHGGPQTVIWLDILIDPAPTNR